jgi:hypothetical protein
MRKVGMTPVTAQRKIIANTDKFNNAGIKRQQGTTRAIYDSLPLDGRTVFRFFEESNNRNFPFTNTGADGNKLPVGNALAIERAYFSVVFVDPDTQVITSILDLTALGLFDVTVGELSIEIANSQVLKQVPLLSFDPRFNKNAAHADYNNFEFDTQLVLNPLLEFVFPTRVNTYAPVLNAFLRLTIEGTGAIIAPRATF